MRRSEAPRSTPIFGGGPARIGPLPSPHHIGTSLTFSCPRAEAHPLSTWGSLAWVPKRLRERGGRTNGHRNGHQLPWPEGDWQASSNTNQGENPNKSTLTTTRRDRTNQVPEDFKTGALNHSATLPTSIGQRFCSAKVVHEKRAVSPQRLSRAHHGTKRRSQLRPTWRALAPAFAA